jgi:hypothetical protein
MIDVATGFSPSGDGLKPVTTSGWGAFKATLDSYRAASRQLTVSGVLDLVVRTAKIEDIYAMTEDGHRAARHLVSRCSQRKNCVRRI